MSRVLSALGGALPDERPLRSLQVVDSLAKCPAGYVPVHRTYDEDADAGLMRHNGLFGKKLTHYICLSKSEGVPGYVMDGVLVVGEREAAPAGFSVAARLGKRRLCTRVSRQAPAHVTDVIVCSKMRQAPHGFVMAGEINGKVVCYKTSGGSPAHAPADYENVVSHVTPDAARRLRAVPERPPKTYPLISELAHLSMNSPPAPPAAPPAPPAGPGDEFSSGHDYEALSPAYQLKPARPAPRPPAAASPPGGQAVSIGAPVAAAPPAARRRPPPTPGSYLTLDGYSGLEGVPFLLNPRLRGLPSDDLLKMPVVKRRSRLELDRDYSYSFAAERQA